MSSTQQVLAAGPRISVRGPRRPSGHRHLRGSDFRWAIAFVLPYAAVFFVFVVYPFGYALWMARKPSLYAELITDRSYLPTVVNTLLFVGLGVNVKMFLALAAVRLLPAPPLVDQGLAGRLYFALGDRGGPSLRLVSLDAAAGGFGQRRIVGAVRDRGSDVVQ